MRRPLEGRACANWMRWIALRQGITCLAIMTGTVCIVASGCSRKTSAPLSAENARLFGGLAGPPEEFFQECLTYPGQDVPDESITVGNTYRYFERLDKAHTSWKRIREGWIAVLKSHDDLTDEDKEDRIQFDQTGLPATPGCPAGAAFVGGMLLGGKEYNENMIAYVMGWNSSLIKRGSRPYAASQGLSSSAANVAPQPERAIPLGSDEPQASAVVDQGEATPSGIRRLNDPRTASSRDQANRNTEGSVAELHGNTSAAETRTEPVNGEVRPN